jgi:hypothetical protein
MPTSITGNGQITSTSGKISTTGTFVSPNSVVQRIYAQKQSGSSHISTTNTSDQTLDLEAIITPRFSNSIIMVEWYSTMAYGAGAGWLNAMLYRKIGTGSYNAIIAKGDTGWASTPWPYLAWMHTESSWGPRNLVYFDTPNTTTNIIYQLRYSKWTTNSNETNYLVHCCQHWYGWILTEIAQ